MGKIKNGLVGLATIAIMGTGCETNKPEENPEHNSEEYTTICETFRGYEGDANSHSGYFYYVFDPLHVDVRNREPNHKFKGSVRLAREMETGERYCAIVEDIDESYQSGRLVGINPEENHSQNNNSKYNSH